MFEVHITSTGRNYGRNQQYHILNEQSHRFDSKQAVQTFLKEQYGTCKRVKMYCDKKDGSTDQVGYIYGFHNADWSHAPVEKWLQQDWVSIVTFEAEPVLLN